jgi:hypothetical protein
VYGREVGKEELGMEIVAVIVAVAGYVALTRWVLPRLGVRT